MPLAAAQRLLGKPGLIKAVFVSNRGGGVAARRSPTVVGAARRRSPRSGSRPTTPSRTRSSDADDAGRGVHVDVHDVRLVLDRRRHPADLPDLRDARRRAPRRARHRARGRHPPRPPRPDVPLRGRRLRPGGRGASARCSASRRVRDGARDGERVRLEERPRRSRFSVKPRERRHRLRHRRAADARRRRVLGLAREPDEHRQRDPQPARAAAQSGAGGALAARRSRVVLGALLIALGRRREDAITLGFGVLARDPRPRPDRARLAGAPRPRSSYTAPGSRSSCGSCCRSSAGCSAT